MLVVFEAMSTRSGAVVNDDVLYRFRLRLFSLAAELGNVRAACRIMGVHPSTYYLAADGAAGEPLLLHLAAASAPASALFPNPLLIGRMRAIARHSWSA